MGQSVEKQDKCKSRLVVLPFQPQEEQSYDGIGLAIHFLLGNIVAIHTGLKEFWFGWRVKKIFPEKERLVAYCRGEGTLLKGGFYLLHQPDDKAQVVHSGQPVG